MHRISTRFCCLLGAVLALAAGSAAAVPLPVGPTSASDLIVNFDFTSATPPPPYTTLSVSFVLANSMGPEVAIDYFGGLGGTDYRTTFSFVNATGGTVTVSGASYAPLLDGIFSLGFRADSGDVQLVSTSATETVGNRSATITGVLAAASVPEPSSIALLGAGAIVSILAGRRRRRDRNERIVRVE